MLMKLEKKILYNQHLGQNVKTFNVNNLFKYCNRQRPVTWIDYFEMIPVLNSEMIFDFDNLLFVF